MQPHEKPDSGHGDLGDAAVDERASVRRAYGRLAIERSPGPQAGGCAGALGAGCSVTPASQRPETASLPDDPTRLALGCGDSVTLARLAPGQVVLDLGAGGGMDCFTAAQRVGPGGRVIGVDMTAAMLDRARAARARMGIENVEFRLGEIEHLPVADETVDVVVSNCVINLSPDKPQVFREAFRVLKPGGTLAVTDMMTDGPLPQSLLEGSGEWTRALSGVLEEKEYLAAIEAAGFVDVEIARVYPQAEGSGHDVAERPSRTAGEPRARAVVMVGETGEIVNATDLRPNDPGFATRSFSGEVRARKPERGACQ